MKMSERLGLDWDCAMGTTDKLSDEMKYGEELPVMKLWENVNYERSNSIFELTQSTFCLPEKKWNGKAIW